MSPDTEPETCGCFGCREVVPYLKKHYDLLLDQLIAEQELSASKQRSLDQRG